MNKIKKEIKRFFLQSKLDTLCFLVNDIPWWLRSSNKPMCMGEIKELVRKYGGPDWGIRINPDLPCGGQCNGLENRLVFRSEKVTREMFFHELGHLHLKQQEGTNNYRFNSLQEGDIIPIKLQYELEKEAWEWAKANSGRKWGLRARITSFCSLETYFPQRNSKGSYIILEGGRYEVHKEEESCSTTKLDSSESKH